MLIPSAFAGFRKSHPRVEMRVVEEGSLAIRARLERGEIDIGILIISDLPDGLATLPIGRGELRACLPREHPLARQPRIAFDMLRDQPLVLFREDTYSRRLIVEECARHRFEPKIVFSSSQIDTVLGLVRQGVGIAFFIEELVRNQQSIEVRPLAEPLVLHTGLAWNRERYLSNAARAFIDSFRSFQEAPGGSAPLTRRRASETPPESPRREEPTPRRPADR